MKIQVVAALQIIACVVSGTAATDYVWNGPDNGSWSEPINWIPNGTPGADLADTVQISAASNTVLTIISDVSCAVHSVTTSGHVVIRGTLDSTGRPNITLESSITNSGFLDVWNMNLKGRFNNQSGASVKLREIRGSVELVNEGELRWYFINVLDETSSLTNHGMMHVIDPAALVSYGSMLNTGTVSIGSSNLSFEAGATLSNEGVIYGAGYLLMINASLVNSGTINSIFGNLVVVSSGDTLNEGYIYNHPGTLLFMTTRSRTSFLNRGHIRVYSGGGVNLFPSTFINESGGLIQLAGGFLKVWDAQIKPYSSIDGRGELIGSLLIEQDATANFHRELTVTDFLELEPLAELSIEDGELLVEGDILNEGTIRLKSGRLIPRGRLLGSGQIIWDISEYNTLTDYNFDGTVNIADLAVFAQTWLWQSSL